MNHREIEVAIGEISAIIANGGNRTRLKELRAHLYSAIGNMYGWKWRDTGRISWRMVAEHHYRMHKDDSPFDYPPQHDHPFGGYFDTDGAAVAMGIDPYNHILLPGVRSQMNTWASEHGLAILLPPIQSPYYPGSAVTCLFVRPETLAECIGATL
jgi:hypothetical protein